MHMEIISGSVAYGTSGTVSDWDIVGICIPRKEEIFPTGYIEGFGKKRNRFRTWQKHHIDYKEKEYDICIYNIVDFFDLCMNCNPNMISYLYVPDNCVLHSTQVGNLIRENRSIFLSKLCWPRFKGYAYSMLKKLTSKKHKGLDKLRRFEFDHNISNDVTFDELINEIKRRNLMAKI